MPETMSGKSGKTTHKTPATAEVFCLFGILDEEAGGSYPWGASNAETLLPVTVR